MVQITVRAFFFFFFGFCLLMSCLSALIRMNLMSLSCLGNHHMNLGL